MYSCKRILGFERNGRPRCLQGAGAGQADQRLFANDICKLFCWAS